MSSMCLSSLYKNYNLLIVSNLYRLIMRTWTEQMGLPVVEIKKEANSYTLTQKRFFANPEDYNGKYDDSAFK